MNATEWDDPTMRTPSFKEFEEMQKADSNLWWRIGCGHHENLYDAAVDEVERLEGLAERFVDQLGEALGADGTMTDIYLAVDLLLVQFTKALEDKS